MAKKGGNPQNLRPPYQKGQSGNPSGRPKNAMTAGAFKKIIDRLGAMTRVELQAVIQNPKTTMYELQLASAFAHGVKTGDYGKVALIIDRTIGKVRDDLHITTPAPYIVEKRDGAQIEMGISPSEDLEVDS